MAEWVRLGLDIGRFDDAEFDPRGVVIARLADEWAGMSATSLRADQGVAFADMTGVLRPYRGGGLSLA
jgi:hypothetical protein